jgi:hypothetical protein
VLTQASFGFAAAPVPADYSGPPAADYPGSPAVDQAPRDMPATAQPLPVVADEDSPEHD